MAAELTIMVAAHLRRVRRKSAWILPACIFWLAFLFMLFAACIPFYHNPWHFLCAIVCFSCLTVGELFDAFLGRRGRLRWLRLQTILVAVLCFMAWMATLPLFGKPWSGFEY